jgi:hypothetical protein
MRAFRVSICLTLIAATLGLVSVSADAYLLSGPLTGVITVFPLGDGIANTARLKIQSNGIEMLVNHTDSGVVDALIACMPCVPGDELDLSALFSNDDMGEGVVTMGDERVRDAFVAGHLVVRAGTVRVPDNGRLTLALKAPFTLEDGGVFQIYTSDAARMIRDVDALWAQGPIAGSGTATIVLNRLDLPDQIAYVVERIKYAFD